MLDKKNIGMNCPSNSHRIVTNKKRKTNHIIENVAGSELGSAVAAGIEVVLCRVHDVDQAKRVIADC